MLSAQVPHWLEKLFFLHFIQLRFGRLSYVGEAIFCLVLRLQMLTSALESKQSQQQKNVAVRDCLGAAACNTVAEAPKTTTDFTYAGGTAPRRNAA